MLEIRPIRTEDDYEAALAEVERLFDAEPGTPEADRLEVWILLVEAYEEKHYPIPLPDPIEAIEYYMDSRGLARRDLEPYIGNRARVSEILNRRRPLSLRMIRNLEEGLGIPAEVLVQPYELSRAVAHGAEHTATVYEDWEDSQPEQLAHERLVVAMASLIGALANDIVLELDGMEAGETQVLSWDAPEATREEPMVETGSAPHLDEGGSLSLLHSKQEVLDQKAFNRKISYLPDYMDRSPRGEERETIAK